MLSEEFLIEEYINKNKNMAEIALELNIPQCRVYKFIKDYNIKKTKTRKDRIIIDIIDVINKYQKEHMSLSEIASTYNVSVGTIAKRLKSQNIKLRPPSNFEDLTGQERGYWKILYIEEKGNYNKIRWLCECTSCGRKKYKTSSELNSGKTKSCGCQAVIQRTGKRYSWKGYGDISRTYFNHLVYEAKSRSLEFNLTIEQLWDLFLTQNKKCALSGIDIFFSKYYSKEKYLQTASLDRIDSSKGYVLDNVQWLHKDINMMKNKLEETQFINYCRVIINYQDNK